MTAHGLQIQRASRERASQGRQGSERGGPQPWKQAYDAARQGIASSKLMPCKSMGLCPPSAMLGL